MSLTLTRRHNVDRFGYLIPTRYGNVPMVGAVATYRPGEGRFGGAVAVEEETTNLIADPFMDGSRTFSTLNLGGSTSEVVRGQPPFRFGTASILCRKTNNEGNTRFHYAANFSETEGDTYSVSAVIKVLSGPAPGFTTSSTSGDSYQPHTPIITPLEDGWELWQTTYVANRGDRNARVMFIAIEESEFIVDAIQVERKPFPTSFVDGTREAGRLQYDSGLVNPDSFTIAAWVLADWIKVTRFGRVWELRRPSSSDRLELIRAQTDEGFRLYFSLGGTEQFGINKTGFPSGWYHTAVTFDGNQYRLYVNGESVINVAHTEKVGADWRLYVGCSQPAAASSLFWNSLIDELLILPYAASEEEIRSWYEADGPLPPHPDATLQWDWQAVRPATMVAL